MPDINGKPSKLYKEIDKNHKGNKPLVNLIYASYLLEGVAAQMDADGYKRNAQGQHFYKDIYKFLGLKDFINEQGLSTLENDGINLGTRTQDLKYVVFQNFEDAYRLAQDYNDNHTGRFAYVVQNGDGFNIILENKDSLTIRHLNNFKEEVVIWEAFKEKLRNAGLNADDVISFLSPDINPATVLEQMNMLDIMKSGNNDLMSKNIIKTFLKFGETLPEVQTLLSRWGLSLEETAQKCYDILQNPTSVSASTLNLVNNVLNKAKYNAPFNVHKFINHIFHILPGINQTDKKIIGVLNDLKNNKQISPNIIERKSKKIKSLTEAVQESIVSVTREINALEEKSGITTGLKKLENTRKLLEDELANKRVQFGVCKFLEEALQYTTDVYNILTNVSIGSTKAENIRNRAEAVERASNLIDCYYHIIEALANIESLTITENISAVDKKTLEDKAKEVKELLDTVNKILEEERKNIVIDNLIEELGEDSQFGRSYVEIAELLHSDGSIIDYVGQLGKSSDPILASVGSLIRKKQLERDEEYRQYSIRIGSATKALYKAGYDSEFMYDSNGRIITEEGVDWESYNEARKNAIIHFTQNLNYKGFVLKEAIEKWEEQNTEPKLVDKTTGRTERIPNDSYRLSPIDNPFNKLSQAQKDYYYEMMDIKGELGSSLPHYAQDYYLPTQERASVWDLIKRCTQGEITLKRLIKLLRDKISLRIKEDETEYFIYNTKGNFNNTVKKDIPIYYINPISNQDEILKDFSAGLQHFASTALNYKAMSSIRAIVETIQNHVNNLDTSTEQEVNDKEAVENISYYDDVNHSVIILTKTLHSKLKDSTSKHILESWIDAQIYNKKHKKNNKATKAWMRLIGYNSVTKLAVNVLGAASNLLQGIAQMIIEAGGREFYNFKDLIFAFDRFLGPVGAGWDLLLGNKRNLNTLISEFFNMTQDTYSDLSKQRYHKNAFRRLIGGINSTAMYQVGEYMMRNVGGFAVLNHEKVLINGKKRSLRSAFKVSGDKYHPTLALKDNVTTLDGQPLTLDSDFFKDIKLKVKSASDNCFGAMSQEDKGVINKWILGRMAMNFRQWMVDYYSNRFRLKHWDYTKGKMVEGFHITPFRVAWEYIQGFKDLIITHELTKYQLTDQDKVNLRKALTEYIMLGILMGLSLVSGDINDDDNWWERFYKYLLKRLRKEVNAGTPVGIITESKSIIKNPIPIIKTMEGIVYPITGIPEVMETIEQGRYEGWNLYYRNFLWNTVPFYKQIDQLMHMDEEDALFTIFDTKL